MFAVAVLAVVCGIVVDRCFLDDSEHLQTMDDLLSDSTLSVAVPPSSDTLSGASMGQPVCPAAAGDDAALFVFDPNTADSASLLQLGFSPWQVRSIYSYRAKGGRFHRVEDIKRIYGMTPEHYNRISSYVSIASQYRYYEDLGEEYMRSPSADNPRRQVGDSAGQTSTDKFTEPVSLDLNAVDTSTLKRVPGLGSYRSRQIVEYREALGGFVTPAQLTEIDGLPAGIEQWFTVETSVFRRLNINTASVHALARHPYLSYSQALAIDHYRRMQGHISNVRELQLLDEFAAFDFQRLDPYVEY